jgi:hypothetical protein
MRVFGGPLSALSRSPCLQSAASGFAPKLPPASFCERGASGEWMLRSALLAKPDPLGDPPDGQKVRYTPIAQPEA